MDVVPSPHTEPLEKKKKGRHWFEVFEHNLLKSVSEDTGQRLAILT